MSSKRSYSNFLDSKEFPFTIENNYKIKFPKLFSKLNIYWDSMNDINRKIIWDYIQLIYSLSKQF